jgi:hypothetical protein
MVTGSRISDEPGKREIYVRTFPGPGGKWQISSAGGRRPRWSTDGKKLYYLTGSKLTEVNITGGAAVQVGTPRSLFSLQGSYEVLPEGKFLVNEPMLELGDFQTVVLNWDATLGFNK